MKYLLYLIPLFVIACNDSDIEARKAFQVVEKDYQESKQVYINEGFKLGAFNYFQSLITYREQLVLIESEYPGVELLTTLPYKMVKGDIYSGIDRMESLMKSNHAKTKPEINYGFGAKFDG